MKNIFFLVLFCAALLGKAGAQCANAFYDGFESGSYSPTWTMGAGLTSGAVTTTNPAVGSYRLEGAGGTGVHLTGFSTTFPSATPSAISWRIFPTGNVSTNYFVCGNATITPTNCLVFCYWFGSTSGIRFVSTSTIIYPAAPGQWYSIELRNVNYVSRTFDIYINNVLFQAAFPFRSTVLNSVSNAHLYNYNSGVGVWDEIRFGSTPVTLSASTVNTSCFGTADGSVNLSVNTGTPNYTYLWSSTDTTQDITGLAAGSYSVLVTDAVGCTATASYTITSPPLLIASAGTDTAVCAGQSIQLGSSPTASGGTPSYTYIWAPGPLSGPNPSTAPANTTTYIVTVTDINNCSASASVNVTVNPLPNPVITWSGDTLYANTTGSIFQWNLNGSPVSAGPANFYATTTPGNYTVTVTSVNGCTATSVVYPLTTGIANEMFEAGITVFPNPAAAEIRVESLKSKVESIEVYGMPGEKVYSKTLNVELRTAIDVSKWQAGIYLVKVRGEKTEATIKLVKE